MKKTFLFLFVLGWIALWAKDEVEIPVDLGLGPSFFYMPGLVSDQNWHTGFRLELYAVIDHEAILKFKNKIPKKYRGLAAAQREVHVAPMIMYLVPDAVIVSPGGGASVYGATWTFLGIGMNLLDTRPLDLSLNIDLPTLSYLHVHSLSNNPENQNLFGVGITPSLKSQICFTKHFLVDISYYHTFQLPLSINTYRRDGEERKHWNNFGELSVVLNYRFGRTQKL